MLLPALPSASGPFVGPGDRYPNRQLKTKSVPVWLLADSQPHSLHSLKRFFWRRSIVINHFGSKGASPALPSAPPCTEARRGPILARKRWASGIPASTLSSSGAGPNPCSPTTKPEFPLRLKPQPAPSFSRCPAGPQTLAGLSAIAAPDALARHNAFPPACRLRPPQDLALLAAHFVHRGAYAGRCENCRRQSCGGFRQVPPHRDNVGIPNRHRPTTNPEFPETLGSHQSNPQTRPS